MLIKLVPTKKTPLSLFPFYFLDTIEIRLKRATSIRTKKEKLKSIIRSRLTDITSSISLSVGSVVQQANHLDFPWLLLWLLVKFKSFSRFFEFPMINSNFLSSFLFHHPLVQIHPVFKILWKWMKWWKKGVKNFELCKKILWAEKQPYVFKHLTVLDQLPLNSQANPHAWLVSSLLHIEKLSVKRWLKRKWKFYKWNMQLGKMFLPGNQ